jgi:HNH endonuclease
MPSSDDRFYLLEMRNRPVLLGDIGSLVRISGLVISGGGAWSLLLLPDYRSDFIRWSGLGPSALAISPEMTIEDWSDFIQRSDNPEILIGPAFGNTTMPKIFQRKVRWEISGAVQQKVWAADGFKCVYCGVSMGRALLTVDHVFPLELNGKNDTSNYVSSCKACNKDKGSEDPQTWCKRKNIDFEKLMSYLASRKIS